MKLYEIEQAIEGCVDLETGEIIDAEKLEELNIECDRKIENIALWIKNLTAEADAIKTEKMSLAKRQSVCENKADSLKAFLSGYLAGERFKTAKVAISYRKSEAVEITGDVPDAFLIPQEPKIDKAEIKTALKAGKLVEGAKLIERQNIQIK